MTLYLGFLHKHQGLDQPMLKEYPPASASPRPSRWPGAVTQSTSGHQVRYSPDCSLACTTHSALCMPAMRCLPLLSNCRRSASPARSAAGAHVSSAEGAACAQTADAQLVQQPQQAIGHCQQEGDPGLLMHYGKWVDAHQYVALSEKARLPAVEQLPQPVAALLAEAARVVHDAALLCCPLSSCMSCAPALTPTTAAPVAPAQPTGLSAWAHWRGAG